MRVLFVVSDYPGHYFPMVPLGWALQAAGHEVRLVCGPGEVSSASRTGLPVVGCGSTVDTIRQARLGYYRDALDGIGVHPGLMPLHPLTGEPMASLSDFDWAAYEPMHWAGVATEGRERTRAIAGLARQWRPDLVVHDLLSPEGLVAAHAVAVPAVCHLWGPTGTDETGPGLARLRPDVPAAVRERLGMPLDADLIGNVVDPCPPALAPAVRANRLPVRYVPYSGPAGTAAAVAAGIEGTGARRRRIGLVWSNSLSQIFGAGSFIVPAVIEAATGLDVDLVMTLSDGDADRLGPVPSFVRVLRQQPAALLLAGCQAVVHHGGAGCLMTAVALGLPQLALPYGVEQELIATRVAAAGAGLVIRGSAASTDVIREALSRLLADPSFPAAARALADANAAAPSPADLVSTLVALAGTGRAPAAGPRPEPALAARPT